MAGAAYGTGELGLGPDPAAVREILVLRPGGLGDMVKAVPALRHLRDIYPEGRITVMSGSPALDLVRSCPFVDRCVSLDAAAQLAPEEFDLLVSFAEPGADPAQTGAVGLGAPLRFRAAATYRSATDAAVHPVHPVWPARLPDADRMLRLVWLLGGCRPEATLSLWPTLADRNAAARIVEGLDEPIMLLHPWAGTDARRWPADRFARVIDTAAGMGLVPVVIGLSDEVSLCDALREAATQPWMNVVGRTSAGVLAGLLERASLFVGNDSGPAVLAAALGVHSIVIAPGTAIEQVGRVDRTTYITAGTCSTCYDVACDHTLADASTVPPDAVLAHVALAARSARRRWERQRILSA